MKEEASIRSEQEAGAENQEQEQEEEHAVYTPLPKRAFLEYLEGTSIGSSMH